APAALQLADATTGERQIRFDPLTDILRDNFITEDGHVLVAYTTEAAVGYDVATAKTLYILPSRDSGGPFQGFAIHPSREKFLLATFNELIEYDTRTGKELGRADSGYD